MKTPQIAVSTWSLHNLLGVTYANGPGVTPTGIAEPTFGPGAVTLGELPEQLARRGYDRVEICHFESCEPGPGLSCQYPPRVCERVGL